MKFVTYNIHFGVGRDENANLDRIAEAIDGADVIALQEVERFWPRSGMIDQPLALGKRLPDYWWVYGPNIDLHSSETFPGEAAGKRRQFGNMILAKRPILASENLPLPRLPGEPRSMRRGALEAIVGTPTGGLRIVSTHLCYLSAPTRVAQAEHLFARHAEVGTHGGAWDGEHPADPSWYLGDEPTMPPRAIIMGDLNFDPSDPEYAATIGRADVAFADAWPLMRSDRGATKDGQRIDHAWLTKDLGATLRWAWVDDSADGSDHQPVWFDLDI